MSLPVSFQHSDLPDCPRCNANDTLTIDQTEKGGTRVCWCSCCAQRCRVDQDGRAYRVELDSVLDVNGTQMYES